MTELAAARRSGPATTMAAVLVSLFVALGVLAHHAAAGTAFDHEVLAWMVHHRSPGLTSLAIAVTTAGSPVATGMIAAIAAAVLWWRSGSPRPAILVVLSLAATETLALLGVLTVVIGHRTSRAAHGALIALAAALTALVAVTGRYLGVHWVTDTIGGLLRGGAAVVIAHLAYRRMMGLSDNGGGPGAYARSGPVPAVSA